MDKQTVLKVRPALKGSDTKGVKELKLTAGSVKSNQDPEPTVGSGSDSPELEPYPDWITASRTSQNIWRTTLDLTDLLTGAGLFQNKSMTTFCFLFIKTLAFILKIFLTSLLNLFLFGVCLRETSLLSVHKDIR